MSLLSRELTDCPPRRGLYRMTTAAQTLHRYTLSSLHALRWLRHSVVAVCLWIWSTALYLAKHKGTKLEHIQRDIKQLKKLPVHLALLVNEREVSCSDLARLVNWCFCVGIHYVSLYDPRGTLRSNVESLRHEVEQEHQSLFSPACEHTVIVSSSDDYQGHPPHNDVHTVLVLAPGDGRSQLARVARSLCGLVQQHRMTPSQVDTTLINNKLTGSNRGFPDPNLAVVMGAPPSLLGYTPWHTRLTEILFISSHHKITYQQFHSLLLHYANTTQRHGK